MAKLKKVVKSWPIIPSTLMVFTTGTVQSIATLLVFGNWLVVTVIVFWELERAIRDHPKANAELVASLAQCPDGFPANGFRWVAGILAVLGFLMLSLLRWGPVWVQVPLLIVGSVSAVFRIFGKGDVQP